MLTYIYIYIYIYIHTRILLHRLHVFCITLQLGAVLYLLLHLLHLPVLNLQADAAQLADLQRHLGEDRAACHGPPLLEVAPALGGLIIDIK